MYSLVFVTNFSKVFLDTGQGLEYPLISTDCLLMDDWSLVLWSQMTGLSGYLTQDHLISRQAFGLGSNLAQRFCSPEMRVTWYTNQNL